MWYLRWLWLLFSSKILIGSPRNSSIFVFRVNPSWNLSSSAPSSGRLHQVASALLSLGFPHPYVAGKVNPGLRIHVPVGPQGHWDQRPWGAGHLWVPSTSTDLYTQHNPTNICWIEGKVTPLSLALAHNLWKAPTSFHLTITVESSMLLWC